MPERQCEGCRRQEEWGCHAKPYTVTNENGEVETRWINPAHLPINLLGEDTWACPRQHIRENPTYWATILKYYAMYRRGFLPDKGAIVDQSNRAIELFRILDDANDACDHELMKKDQERQSRAMKTPRRRG